MYGRDKEKMPDTPFTPAISLIIQVKKALEAGLESGYQAKAERELAELERILKGPKPASDRHTQHVAASEIEKRYIRFCVDNRLYLHPCPVSSHEAYQDPLSVRFPTGVKNEYMEMRSNQLALIKRMYRARNIDDERFPARQLQQLINGAKEEGLRPNQVEARDEFSRRQIEHYASYEQACQREGPFRPRRAPVMDERKLRIERAKYGE